MLLNELRKHTPDDDPDYQTLTTALERIRAVADHVNQRLREDSSNNRCIEIDRIVHGLPHGIEIVHPSRKFVHEGRLLQIRRRSVRELYLFAFNDMILYCTPRGSSSTRSDEFDCKGAVHLSESSWLNMLPDNSMFSNVFQVVTKTKVLTFSASTLEEKKRWIHDIEEQFTTLRANHNATNPAGDRVSLLWNPGDVIGNPPPTPLPATKQPPINSVELLQLVIDAGKESMFMGMALFGFVGSPVRFELNFEPGNMLEVFETVDDHWWIGRIINTDDSPQQFGLVPAHFFHFQAAEHMRKPRRRGSVSGMIIKRLSLKIGETDSSDLSPQSNFTHGSPDRERPSSEFSPDSRAASTQDSASQPRDSSSPDYAARSSNPLRRSLNIGSALKRLSLKVNNSHSNLSEDGSLSQQPLVVEASDHRRRTSAAADFLSKIGKKLPWGHKSRKSEGSFDSHSRAVPDPIVVSTAHSEAPTESEDGEFERFEKEFAEKLRKTGVHADSPTSQSNNSNPEWNRAVDIVRTNATRADTELTVSPTNPSPKARRKSLGIHRPSKSAPLE